MATYQWVNRDTFTMDELVMYGSSRLGTYGVNVVLCDTVIRDSAWCAEHDTSTNPFTDSVTYFTAGLKQYEFTNHLGNVLLTLTDRHIPFYFGGVSYIAEVASAQDYYPFGMEMVGRVYNPALYRFGFNGKEDDNEVKGVGNQQNYGMRIYDPRLGRFLSVDPLTKKYPELTPYQFASNRVIEGIDWDGMEFRNYMEPGVAEVPGDNNPVDEDVLAEQSVGTPGSEGGGGLVNEEIPQTNKPVEEEKLTQNTSKPTVEKVKSQTVEQNTQEPSEANNSGRQGRQERLKELGNDPKTGKADKGWIKSEQNQIKSGNRTNIRNPPGKQLAHERGREAAKGYSYKNSNLQDKDLHQLQHKYDNNGRLNKERPIIPITPSIPKVQYPGEGPQPQL